MGPNGAPLVGKSRLPRAPCPPFADFWLRRCLQWSLQGLFGRTFRCWRAPEGALQLHFPCKHLEGLFGGTFCRWRAPSYIFPVDTFAIGGRQTIAKGAFGAQGGMTQCPPAYAPDSILGIKTLLRKIAEVIYSDADGHYCVTYRSAMNDVGGYCFSQPRAAAHYGVLKRHKSPLFAHWPSELR